SATPAEFELERSDAVVEQIIRPTGLLDPLCEVRETEGQIDDLIGEILQRVEKKERILVVTLTKKMAEDLTEYLSEKGIRVRYMHHNVETMERVELLKDLRRGEFDVLVGINLLREGLDLPEVSLIAILDADKEGFLRSERSLIQIIGRAARHVDGKVIMYADQITDSMKRAMDETSRRRSLQDEYNKAHGITPKGIEKKLQSLPTVTEKPTEKKEKKKNASAMSPQEKARLAEKLRFEMMSASKRLDFETAAILRDKLRALQNDQK
ncbi:MAG: UvrB/UvrC motif-containing protein, partial [Clostridia bacterium]|nr:UvrB/UvrC motif-containing protein [Clostridia bacterium]